MLSLLYYAFFGMLLPEPPNELWDSRRLFLTCHTRVLGTFSRFPEYASLNLGFHASGNRQKVPKNGHFGAPKKGPGGTPPLKNLPFFW